MTPTIFRRRLLAWYDRHGRKDLPWKRGRDPYRIWLAEIMLQQTQVRTVLPYYARFVRRFPSVEALAHARRDSVLRHWAGLGYYARARNLHRAAKEIVRYHRGRFPREYEAIAALPGIGRSTAGAIAAQAFDAPCAILDGNVKRVLARVHAIESALNERHTEQRLWQLAETYTPRHRVADYTQAIMDLGATVCRPRRADCARCPLAVHCAARRLERVDRIPHAHRRAALPVRVSRMLLLADDAARVLLVRRPPTGIWGGLWSLPELDDVDPQTYCRRAFGLEVVPGEPWPVRRHSFTHFHLDIMPVPATLRRHAWKSMENPDVVWYNPRARATRGVAAPVRQLIQQLTDPAALRRDAGP